ncbi:MAG: hypothetical protein KBT03_04560 [Bacteroidales bacterium]|nr:hypothetical protein [Candidatus Scybalousia scybalohippi]
MTFEELQNANEAIKTTTISNKEYAEVNQRIKAFRMLFPEGSILTELVSNVNGVCVMRATIYKDERTILGTGTAYEKEGNGFINKTSYIENCETSAVGRALAMCGIGIDTSIASYEEVANAKVQQEQPMSNDDRIKEAELKSRVIKYINDSKMSKENIEKLCKKYGVGSVSELTMEHCKDYIARAKKGGIEI